MTIPFNFEIFYGQDVDGTTPLHHASWDGHSFNAQLLVPKANWSPQEKIPIRKGSRANRFEIAQMLIENGAKVDVGDSFGLTPLHLAAFDGRVDMIRLLLRCGHFCQTSYPSASTIPS